MILPLEIYDVRKMELFETDDWQTSLTLLKNSGGVYCWYNSVTGIVLTMMRSYGIRKPNFFETLDENINAASNLSDVMYFLAVRCHNHVVDPKVLIKQLCVNLQW